MSFRGLINKAAGILADGEEGNPSLTGLNATKCFARSRREEAAAETVPIADSDVPMNPLPPTTDNSYRIIERSSYASVRR